MFLENVVNYKESISVLAKTQDILRNAASVKSEAHRLTFGFLLVETPKIFLIGKNRFFNGNTDLCREARSCCYYLIRKHTLFSDVEIGKRFGIHPSNIARNIKAVASAIETERTFEEMIKRISSIENNLQEFIKSIQDGN